ncbi:MAG: spore germination protein GerW family protein [Candidatus Marinimicrobia bacterium]|jgi:sporulation protein YtfJ|nr:spore germination protein GerW family protein [Candidatus Neomarinimicrobiota bacterium]MDP6593579.1 spore germination protein GerW family protein [Candidatus Neomarinimicrobiota bacterium]MDP6836270.1 spore germination protein GerW family protein [Candidatus Neomarinimicrobiota bacterium]MDP6967456.1 spore germination protein GerW family protein [Candidatus Neomarinimicrobiota bacterium]|tara:strand:- start:4638 stop:5015 length:378 start_codon:yes stop_codon:yes gene_type:complete
MAVSELIKNVMKELESVMQTKTVVGDPISAGDYTVIPVSKVSFGFGAGGGGSDEKKKGNTGEGVGGGWSIEPLAFFVVGKEGARLYSLKQEESIMGRLFDLAPKVADTVKDYMDKKGGDERDAEE